MKCRVTWKIEGEVELEADSTEAAMAAVDQLCVGDVLEAAGIARTDHFVEATTATEIEP